jgi:2-polyprenyl-3-methyl-5-hydroxy-6-metoxy-1,4-benzoquinol methylase
MLLVVKMSKKKQIDYFEGLLDKYGNDHRALDWNSPESQRLRCKILKEILIYGKKASNISVLDVGCGFGDLYGFLKQEKLLDRHKIRYTGFDISSKIIGVAKEKYPGAHFEQRDILESRSLDKYDYVFCSGVFNIRTTDIEHHKDYVFTMLERMYGLVNCGVAINFLSEGRLPAADPEGLNVGRYFYFEPEEIVAYCRLLTSNYILRHDYHPGDFTVYLLK